MPTVEQNLQLWNSIYGWTQQGEEWSSTWGGSEAQWHGAILPRIRAFIPTDTILEIAARVRALDELSEALVFTFNDN